MELDNRIPVTIITGFLGAGKTTVLNSIIKQNKKEKFAVIENEFGEIGIDSQLIIGAKDSVFELANGCICCSLNGDFLEIISKLLSSEFSFNYLLVETTGIADPLSVVSAFVANEQIQSRFKIDSVVCIADASNIEDLIDEQAEIRQQLALADTILISKTDCVQEKYVEELQFLLHEINPLAAIHLSNKENLETAKLLNTNSYSSKNIEHSLRFGRHISLDAPAVSMGSMPIIKTHRAAVHRHDIVTRGFSLPLRLQSEIFTMWIHNYLFFNKHKVFRAKGILAFDDLPERYIFHAVRGSFMLDASESWGNETPFCKLVFIGKHIDFDDLEENIRLLAVK